MKPLSAVLKEISEQPLSKDSVNPHFKNRYASLDACQRVVLPILYANGYELHNYTAIEGEVLVLYTEVHAMGEKNQSYPVMKSCFPVGSITDKPQNLGAGMTYARRYNLCALFSLTADDDDDGNAASGIVETRDTPEVKPKSINRFRSLS